MILYICIYVLHVGLYNKDFIYKPELCLFPIWEYNPATMVPRDPLDVLDPEPALAVTFNLYSRDLLGQRYLNHPVPYWWRDSHSLSWSVPSGPYCGYMIVFCELA